MHVLRSASFRSLASIAAIGLIFPGIAGCSKDASKNAATEGAAPTTALAPLPTVPANGTPIPIASIEAVVNPGKLPPYKGPTGSIEGTISISGDPSPAVPDLNFQICPGADKVYGKLFREGAPTPTGRALADAVVAVTGYSEFYLPERADVKAITIEDCAPPRVIDMTVGQRLEIKNNSKQIWAPAIEQAGMPALMVATPGSDAVKLYPPRPGHVILIDKLTHAYARSDLWVLLQPLHAVSGVDGHFRIDGVPVGTVQIGAHLSAIGKDATKSVEVLAGVIQKVELTINYVAAKDAGVVAAPAVDAGSRPQIK